MKKLLLLFFLGIFPSDIIISNAAECSAQSYSVNLVHSRRQVILKGKGGRADKTTRMPTVYPVEAFLERKVLLLDVLSNLSDVVVTITNVETTDIVYDGVFTMGVGIFPIDLSAEKVGNYQLELVSDDCDLIGNFVLE